MNRLKLMKLVSAASVFAAIVLTDVFKATAGSPKTVIGAFVLSLVSFIFFDLIAVFSYILIKSIKGIADYHSTGQKLAVI